MSSRRSTPLPVLIMSALLLVLPGLSAAQTATSASGPVVPVVAEALRGFSLPRVLIWLPKERRVAEQALSEAIVRQAFDNEDIYYRIVDPAEEFEALARTGMFNTFVLFEPEETELRKDFLKDHAGRRQGIAVIGPGKSARALAEGLGFRLDAAAGKNTPRSVSFPPNEGMNLTGSLTIDGGLLYPRKRGATVIASVEEQDRPAGLLDSTGQGKILVLPFSPTASALRAGVTSPYSLLVRAAVLSIAPREATPGALLSEGVSVSAPDAPARVMVRVTAPPGSRIVWTSANGTIEGTRATFEFSAGKEARKVLYLFQPPAAGPYTCRAELSVEQAGRLVSRGIIE